jgi:hypothetical protein
MKQPISASQAINAAMARLRQAQKAKAASLAETTAASEVPEKPKPKHVAPPRRKDGPADAKLTLDDVRKTLRDLGVYRSM